MKMKLIRQSGINAKQVAGGDIYNIGSKSGCFAKLYEKFREELESRTHSSETIEELLFFTKPVSSSLIGLEQKLKNGNREYEVEDALIRKQMFAKSLMKHELYESAQKIYVHILSRILESFKTYVYPEIQKGTNHDEINKVIWEKVITPLEELLDENELELNVMILKGMVYYLTGNCHLKWE